MEFTVRRAGTEHEPLDEGDAFSFGVDDGSTAGHSILFMRTADEDLSEELDLDPYCISLENGRSHYGGVIRIELDRERLRFYVSDVAADALRVDSTHWDLALEISDQSYEELRSGLRRVFSSTNGPELIGPDMADPDAGQ